MKTTAAHFYRISRSLLLTGAVMTYLSGCVVHVGHHDSDDEHERYQSTQSLSLSSDSINRLHIESGAGFVKVRGHHGVSQIEVHADIVSNRRDTGDIDFTLERVGHEAVLVGKARKSGHFGFGSDHAKVNMTVNVPAHLLIEIDDGSGAITLSDIQNDVVIDDGSGSIRVDDVKGNLTILDGSGDIDVTGIDGAVNIDDNSGSLNVEHVTGQVDIDDGSGAIVVRDVTNEVRINDGSGGITIARVSTLNIIESGSGGVSIEDVKVNRSKAY